MRLLLDEMFPAWIAEQLRDGHGHDVVSVLERPDLVGRPDGEVFARAQQEGRAVVTENVRDFRPLARRFMADGEVHHGLVLTTNRRFPRGRAETARRLLAALAALLDGEPGESASSRELWL